MSAVIEQIEILEDDWRGLYKDSWRGVICPESFSHPAKYSRALIRFTYQHVIDCGWIHPGESVVDPFGGVALGGLDAMLNGLNWCGCELEEKFVGLGNQNIVLWNDRYSRMPQWGTARLIQGDSRKLASVLNDARIAVSSPPYAGGCAHNGGDDPKPEHIKGGDYHAVGIHFGLSSPPYVAPPGHGGGDWSINDSKGLYPPSYGESEGQLGAMKEGDHTLAVTSPPFPQPYTSGGGINQRGLDRTDGRPNDPIGDRTYQSKGGERSEGNLETMDAEGFQAAISSPPWEEGAEGILRKEKFKNPEEFATRMAAGKYRDGKTVASVQGRLAQMERDSGKTYGDTENNLGNQRGEDFWTASRIILEQLYQVLTPGAHAVFVVKAFVRNKQIVDFPDQWKQLCEAVGFRLLHHHHALLTEEYGTQTTFHGEDKTLTIARKSFFRRLAESKGSPRIDWESVLCFEKATA